MFSNPAPLRGSQWGPEGVKGLVQDHSTTQAVRDLRLAELPAGPPKAQWEAPLAAAHKAQLPPGGEATAVCLAPPGSPEVMLQTRVASHLEESCMATSP